MKEIKIYEIPNIDYVERIDDPYIGMIFYVADIDTYYSVKTLKEINGINIKGSKVVEYVIDGYADFGTGSGGGSGLTSTQLSNIAKIPAIKSTVDALPNNYASKNHNHSEYASSSHRHDASEIDNLPSGGGTGLTTEQANNIAKIPNIENSLKSIDAVSLNGKKFSEPMTKTEYDAISDKEPNTIYLVDDDTTITGVPDYSSSDAGKVLAVNSTGTGLVWVTLSSSGGGSEEPKTLNSISAVYNQGSTVVYPSTDLDSLKNNLTVTATYSDNSTSVITSDYSLSGNLTVGTSTITVTYLEKTATFNVNVSEPISVDGIVSNPVFYVDARYGQSTSVKAWDNMGTASMTTITTQGPNTENNPDRGFINGALVDIEGQYNFTWSGLPALNDFTTELNCKLGSRGKAAAGMALDSSTNPGSIYQQEDDTKYLIWAVDKQYSLERTVNDKDCIQIRRHGATVEIFKNGQLATTITDANAGATKGTQLKTVGFVGEVYSIIIYDRMLSDEELQQNRDYEASLNRGVD